LAIAAFKESTGDGAVSAAESIAGVE